MDIKGLPTSKRLSKDDLSKNFNDRKEFVTVQPVGSERHAIDTIPMGYHYVQEDVTVEMGSTDNLIVLTAHGARRGDIVRIQSTTNPIEQFELSIDRIVDANSFELSAIVSASFSAGDEISILRPISQRFSPDGAQLTIVQPAPIAFMRNGVDTEVEEDTVDPSNNRPLPVKLTGVSGDINITADNLDVQLSHDGATPDSVQIGDGANLVEVSTDNEMLTWDAKVEMAITALDSSGNGLATEDKQDALIVEATATNAALGTIDGVLDNIEALNAQVAEAEGVAIAHADFLKVGGEDENGDGKYLALEGDRLKVDVGASIDFTGAGLALETTLSAIDTKLPGSLGEKTEATSLSVTLSTENKAELSGINAKLPSVIGRQDQTDSLSVALADDDSIALGGLSNAFGDETDSPETSPVAVATFMAHFKGLLQLADKLNALDDLQDAANAQYSNHETATVSSETTFTAPAGAKFMQIQNSTQAEIGVRFTPSAATPSASNGFYLEIGQSTPLLPAGSFKAIAVAAGNADVTVNWFV